jgi:UDP-glucose 4-epimerase
MIQDYGNAFGIRSVCLRYFNAAGADFDSEIGECHSPETHLIPLAINSAFGSKTPLTIFGSDYPTNDGTCIRDYVHVADLALAHVLALKALENDHFLSRAYNLGNGIGYSVNEIIASIEKITKRKVICLTGERRTGDPPILLADSSKIIYELGWEPIHTDINNIIETSVRWTRKINGMIPK